jgi:hypothetical protein
MHMSAWRRLVAKAATIVVAVGLVSGGVPPANAVAQAVAPSPSATEPAADSEYTMAVTVPQERWWRGKVLPVSVDVTRAGAPVTGRGVFELGGRTYTVSSTSQAALVDTRDLAVGSHEIVVEFSVYDQESATWHVVTSGSTAVQIEEPATPVLTPTSLYVGEPVSVTFDLTGTDEPRSGTVTLQTGMGRVATATLEDGVASVTLAADGIIPFLSQVGATHRDADGDVIARWFLAIDVQHRPVQVTAEMPVALETWTPFELPVRVTSEVGVPEGEIRVVDRSPMAGKTGLLGRGSLVDGEAVIHVDPSSIVLRSTHVDVIFTPTEDSYRVTTQSFWVKVAQQEFTSTMLRYSPYQWTYGRSRRVLISVDSSAGVPPGRVEVWSGGSRIGSATLVDGEASVLIGGKQLDPGNHWLQARYVGPGQYKVSTDAWTERVRKAQPAVRLSLPRTSYAVGANLGTSEPATIRVDTAGMPEHGRLVLWTRDPSARNDDWRSRARIASWTIKPSHDGVRRVQIPSQLLARADGSRGRVYLKVVYQPVDTAHVVQKSSSPVTVRRT